MITYNSLQSGPRSVLNWASCVIQRWGDLPMSVPEVPCQQDEALGLFADSFTPNENERVNILGLICTYTFKTI